MRGPAADMSGFVNLYTYLFEHAVESAPALLHGDQTTTYADLIAHIESAAAVLATLGVRPGDRVAILAENSPFWVAAYLACIKLGASAAPLPLRLTTERLTATIAALGCTALCLDAPRLAKFLAALPADRPILTDKRAANADPRVFEPTPGTAYPTAAVDARQSVAALMFTSGSTGTPNAVKVSHANIQANTDSIGAYLDLSAADRILTILPFEYCFGTSLLHTHLRAGGSLVLQNSFLFLEDVLKKLERTECSGFAGVPATFQHLLRRSSLAKRPYPTLRKVQQAGGRLPTAFIHEFMQAQPQAQLFIMYGQTEATARLSYLPPDRLADKLGSIGRGIPGVSLRVLDDDGQAVAPGAIGEVVAEGANVTLGYWTPDPNKNPFRDGKLYTGDLARIDDEGFIFIVDRVSDFIKPMGHRISSREIEEVLAEIPDVIEAAVIGVPDAMVGEAARAFIVPRVGSALSAQAVTDFCKGKLPPYAVPQQVTLLADLPKNDAGKVLKKELKARYGAANQPIAS